MSPLARSLFNFGIAIEFRNDHLSSEMLKTTAALVSDDYVICVRRGQIPERATLRIRDPRLMITMMLNQAGERRASFTARSDADEAALGGIFMIPPDHEVSVRGGDRFAWTFNCVLARERFDRLMDDRPPLTDAQLTRALDLRSAAVSFCMRQLMKEAVTPGPDSRELADSLMSVLLVEISRELFAGDHAAEDGRTALTDDRLKHVMEYIEAFPTGVPSVDDLAAQCGLSTQYFTRQFRERAGQSIGRFIAASRLRRAERLLIETTLPLKEIAYRLGFANSATFSTAFRNEMGVPPGAYRERRLAGFAELENRAQPILGPGARVAIVPSARDRARRAQFVAPAATVRRAGVFVGA
jgi:AraC family transcriptional regulator